MPPRQSEASTPPPPPLDTGDPSRRGLPEGAHVFRKRGDDRRRGGSAICTDGAGEEFDQAFFDAALVTVKTPDGPKNKTFGSIPKGAEFVFPALPEVSE